MINFSPGAGSKAKAGKEPPQLGRGNTLKNASTRQVATRGQSPSSPSLRNTRDVLEDLDVYDNSASFKNPPSKGKPQKEAENSFKG